MFSGITISNRRKMQLRLQQRLLYISPSRNSIITTHSRYTVLTSLFLLQMLREKLTCGFTSFMVSAQAVSRIRIAVTVLKLIRMTVKLSGMQRLVGGKLLSTLMALVDSSSVLPEIPSYHHGCYVSPVTYKTGKRNFRGKRHRK